LFQHRDNRPESPTTLTLRELAKPCTTGDTQRRRLAGEETDFRQVGGQRRRHSHCRRFAGLVETAPARSSYRHAAASAAQISG
jgi:hypothetical protein